MQLLSLLLFQLTLYINPIIVNAAPAVPLRISADSPALTWHVSHFDIGCSPGGCVYQFNIYGIGTPNTPGFNTTCSGVTSDEEYVACLDDGVLAEVDLLPYPMWNVKVQHRWREAVYEEYYAYGQVNVTSKMENFTIPVTEVYGVA